MGLLKKNSAVSSCDFSSLKSFLSSNKEAKREGFCSTLKYG